LEARTVSEWTSILDLAVKWDFESIKTLAIKELAPIASSIDKIILGRKYHVTEWLSEAYRDICLRQKPLTNEEGMRLGMEDVIKISAIMIRDGYSYPGPRTWSWFSNEELQAHFGLDSGVHQPACGGQNIGASGQGPVEARVHVPAESCDDMHSPALVAAPLHLPSQSPGQGENKDESLGPKPLTTKQKVALRRKKAKADRELQEQLERELAEEAAVWTAHE
jgi:hypothetical protein